MFDHAVQDLTIRKIQKSGPLQEALFIGNDDFLPDDALFAKKHLPAVTDFSII